MPKATKATWPSGVPVFSDVVWWNRGAVFVATDFLSNAIVGINSRGEGKCYRNLVDHELKPLNADARAMLAIAKASAR